MRSSIVAASMLLAASFATQAQNAPAGPPAGSPMANSGIKLDQSPLLNSADTNKDGKLSKSEWAAIGGPDGIFDNIDTNKDGYLTLAELNASSPPDMADANKDGKLTLAEFKAVLAASAPPVSGAPQGTPPQSAPGKSSACPPYADGTKFDPSPVVDAIDTNHDGKMTHDEWQKSGAPEGSWNKFMSYEKVKQQGYVSRADFLAETPPNGVDANCDGKFTLEEFLKFAKTMGDGPGGPPKQP